MGFSFDVSFFVFLKLMALFVSWSLDVNAGLLKPIARFIVIRPYKFDGGKVVSRKSGSPRVEKQTDVVVWSA